MPPKKNPRESGPKASSYPRKSAVHTFDTLGNFTNKQSTQRYNSTASPKHELNYSLDYSYYEGSAHRAAWIGDIYLSYDANGNVIEEREGGPNAEVIAGPSALQKHENLRSVNRGFALVRNPGEEEEEGYLRSYTWDEENRLLAVSDANTDAQFRYDADNQRTVKYAGGTETLYFGQFWQGVTLLGEFRQSKHIYLGETRIATRLNIEGENTSGYELNNTYYYHADHLGSAQHITREPNAQLGEETWYEYIEYTPYGELWEEQQTDSLDMIPFRFTGKEWDEETKLYYYGARYLDPKRGRWLSSDPAMESYLPVLPIDEEARKHNKNLPGAGGIFNLINLNGYHYAGHNPLNYIDPDGNDIYNLSVLGAGVMLTIGGGVNIGIAVDDNGKIATFATLFGGVGVEGSLDTPVTPSFAITRGKNIEDLRRFGPYRIDTGTEITAGAFIGGIIMDYDSQEIVGGNILTVGGGVTKSVTAYFDATEALDMIKDLSEDVKRTFIESLRNSNVNIPAESINEIEVYILESGE